MRALILAVIAALAWTIAASPSTSANAFNQSDWEAIDNLAHVAHNLEKDLTDASHTTQDTFTGECLFDLYNHNGKV
jgi:hypothetical protein